MTYATGGSVTQVGEYRIHTFTGSGTLVVTSPGEFEVLVVAGGGGGGRATSTPSAAGGGGAGGVVYDEALSLDVDSYAITVGSGGAGGNADLTDGDNGGNSSIGSLITAIGGGGGGGQASGGTAPSGGSGGGGLGATVAGTTTGGSGTSGQGNSGGNGNGDNATANRAGAGGGGAGASGGNGTPGNGGNGGVGLEFFITGDGVFYAGGGGGAGESPGSGGTGGGGAGSTTSGVSATANTGGGGGGGRGGNGGNGGSGIVIIRYLIAQTPENVSVSFGEVRWDASGGADTYDVRWSTDESNWTTVSDVTSPWEHTGRASATTYYYQVRAGQSGDYSEWSASVEETTLSPGEYAIRFTPDDDYSTDDDELGWAIWTGAGETGNLVASGVTTAGVLTLAGPIEDEWLDNGPNTRYLVITDGAFNTYEDTFDVEALFDQDHDVDDPAVIDLTDLGTVAVTLSRADEDSVEVTEVAAIALGGAADDAQVDLSDAAEVELTVNLVTDVDTGIIGLSDSAYIVVVGAPVDDEDVAVIDLTESASVLQVIPVTDTDTATVTVDESASLSAILIDAEDGEVGVLDFAGAEVDLDGDDSGPVDVDESAGIEPDAAVDEPVDLEDYATVSVTGAGDAGSVGLTDDAFVSVTILSGDSGAVESDEGQGLSQPKSDQDVAPVTLLEAALIEFGGADLSGQRIRVMVLNSAGETIGAVFQVHRAEYELGLDEVGVFSFDAPPTSEMAPELKQGREVHIHREGEGECFRGLIRSAETTVDASGELVLRVTGDSVSSELIHKNTLLGRAFNNLPMTTVATNLLGGTDWSTNDVAADTRNVTAQFEGVQVWAALIHIAEMFGWHVRERNLSRRVDLGPMGADSGLVFRNVEHVVPGMAVFPINRIVIREQQEELWNWIIPLGSGEGINALTLRHSNRSTPYTRHTMTGPDGTPLYFLRDDASIAEHGQREKVITFKDVIPLSNSTAELRNAANTLYDLSAAWLKWHSQVNETYEVAVSGFRHIVDGQPTFHVGDTLRLQYRGLTETPEGDVAVWRDVDVDVYIMNARREFRADGSDGWTFTVSTVDQREPTDESTIAKALEDLWAVKTARRPFVFREVHSKREPVQSGTNARLTVNYDSNVLYLHQSTLRVVKERIKSTVTGAAAGGGATSSSGGGQTTSAGGGQTTSGGGGQTSSASGSHGHSVSQATSPAGGGHTSGAGDNHSHAVPAQTIFSSGDHFHQWSTAQSTSSWSTPSHRQQVVSERSNGSSFGFFVGRDGSDPATNALYTMTPGAHIHSIPLQTSNAESTHRHAVANHTHTISGQSAATIANHQHTVSDHTHSVSNHQHTVQNHTHTVPDHVHALTYGIYLGPVASTPAFRVIINGTDRTVALGGPWNNTFEVDISPYLTDANGEVLRQNNNIDIQSSQLCDVEMTVRSLLTVTSVVPIGQI